MDEIKTPRYLKRRKITLNDIKIDESIKNNNVLLISQVQNKVFLPYKVKDLNKILNSEPDRYRNMQEIIDDRYIVPLTYYKYPMISRFREAFKLMIEKEKSSCFDAYDLAFELMWKRFLHPSIITACKNLEQLDIYLDCLESNELEAFTFFNIKYELFPKKQKVKKDKKKSTDKKLEHEKLEAEKLETKNKD